MNQTKHNNDQLSTLLSIDTLQEIVRNYKCNEEYIHELIHYTRYKRKKAEYILHEIYQTLQKYDKQNTTSLNINSKSKLKKSIEFFIYLDDKKINNDDYIHQQHNKNQSSFNKTILKEQEKKSILSIHNQSIHSNHSIVNNNTHRVRFNIPENKNNNHTDNSISSYQQKKSTNINDKLSELAHRCEDLLSCLHIHRKQLTVLENPKYYSKQTSLYPQYNQSINIQQFYKHFHPELITHSRQHINLLHKENKYNVENDHKCQQLLPFSYSNLISYHTNQSNSIRLPLKCKVKSNKHQ
ncbi:unnamed protein product [Rotaria sp. Silwood1]|nr:unnamed protein product [Rotaria sp. Silwood1]CAF3481948.1 unnamed protein product [Rotaria sp. Silwood1]